MNVSKVIKEKELLTQTGTPYYASPEVWKDEPYSYKSDLWSIGCVIYELCALRPPFKGRDLDELFMNVCKGKVDRISYAYSDDLWKMILMLLQVDVEKRCDCDKFLNSKLITRKIQEMKNENKDYKNLEKNKEIKDNDLLLDTIKFDNI
jgi:NIMA (never in mitosis gene a)-related kinase